MVQVLGVDEETRNLVLVDEGLRYLEENVGASCISIASVNGPAREGKSLFINNLAGLPHETGSRVGHEYTSQTSGAWMHVSEYRRDHDPGFGPNGTVLVYMDTEGQGGVDGASPAYQRKLMLLSSMLSTTFFYNHMLKPSTTAVEFLVDLAQAHEYVQRTMNANGMVLPLADVKLLIQNGWGLKSSRTPEELLALLLKAFLSDGSEASATSDQFVRRLFHFPDPPLVEPPVVAFCATGVLSVACEAPFAAPVEFGCASRKVRLSCGNDAAAVVQGAGEDVRCGESESDVTVTCTTLYGDAASSCTAPRATLRCGTGGVVVGLPSIVRLPHPSQAMRGYETGLEDVPYEDLDEVYRGNLTALRDEVHARVAPLSVPGSRCLDGPGFTALLRTLVRRVNDVTQVGPELVRVFAKQVGDACFEHFQRKQDGLELPAADDVVWTASVDHRAASLVLFDAEVIGELEAEVNQDQRRILEGRTEEAVAAKRRVNANELRFVCEASVARGLDALDQTDSLARKTALAAAHAAPVAQACNASLCALWQDVVAISDEPCPFVVRQADWAARSQEKVEACQAAACHCLEKAVLDHVAGAGDDPAGLRASAQWALDRYTDKCGHCSGQGACSVLQERRARLEDAVRDKVRVRGKPEATPPVVLMAYMLVGMGALTKPSTTSIGAVVVLGAWSVGSQVASDGGLVHLGSQLGVGSLLPPWARHLASGGGAYASRVAGGVSAIGAYVWPAGVWVDATLHALLQYSSCSAMSAALECAAGEFERTGEPFPASGAQGESGGLACGRDPRCALATAWESWEAVAATARAHASRTCSTGTETREVLHDLDELQRLVHLGVRGCGDFAEVAADYRAKAGAPLTALAAGAGVFLVWIGRKLWKLKAERGRPPNTPPRSRKPTPGPLVTEDRENSEYDRFAAL